MNINDKGLALLKSFEGLRFKAYQDQGGVWTIGYGSTRGVKEGMVISEEQAEAMLLNDLTAVELFLTNTLSSHSVTLSGNRFSALCSLSYNIGVGNFSKSTLLADLIANDMDGASEQFLRWDKVNGIVNPGLLRRREAEKELFDDG